MRISGLLIGFAALLSAGAAQAEGYCDEFAALHWRMAEAVGEDGDAAWEDAHARCKESSCERAMAEAERFPAWCETTWAEQVAGGWVAVCGDADGNPVPMSYELASGATVRVILGL